MGDGRREDGRCIQRDCGIAGWRSGGIAGWRDSGIAEWRSGEGKDDG